MTENQVNELKTAFEKHLQKQYLKGYAEGSKTFVSAILIMIRDGASLSEVESYCQTAIGINKKE